MGHRVGVIGLGKIAAGGMTAYGSPDDPAAYNHCAGIFRSAGVELAAGADMMEEARARFRENWTPYVGQVPLYGSDVELLEKESLDVVAICVRGPLHYEVALRAIEAGPRVIFLEKPPTCSLAEMDDMMRRAADKGVCILASYSRHWATHVLGLQKQVAGGLIGRVEKCVAYSRGLALSMTSHATDLMCQFCGYAPVAVFARGHIEAETREGYEAEPHADGMVVEFSNGALGFQVGGKTDHKQLYADIIGSDGFARVGMYLEPAAWDGEGKSIDLAARGIRKEPVSVFTVAYDQIAAYLDGGAAPDCSGEDMIAVNEIGFAAIESIMTDSRISIPNVERQRRIHANG